jgi:hypothetical protein
MTEPLYRTEEYSEEHQSVTISADWDYASEACRSFIAMMQGHGMSPAEISKYVHKAKADFEAGATMIQVAVGKGFTVSMERLSNLGHPAERQDSVDA